MTPKDLRALASDKALDIGTAWNAMEAAADQIEGLTSRLIESKRKLVEARAALSRIEREVSMILSGQAKTQDEYVPDKRGRKNDEYLGNRSGLHHHECNALEQ